MRHVIVVCEQDALAQPLADIVRAERHVAAICADWRVAQRVVREMRPDLVLLDVLFGGTEYGWIVLGQLLADPATQQIPVLICSTAERSLLDRQDLLKQYRVSAVAAPFHVEHFLEIFRDMLEASAPALPEPEGTRGSRTPSQSRPSALSFGQYHAGDSAPARAPAWRRPSTA